MSLDFSTEAWQANLPAVGSQQATITDMQFIPKEGITWLIITWSLADGSAVEEFLGIDAPKKSSMAAKTANGKRRINGLCEIHGIKPTFKSYDDITESLMGKTATVVVARKSQGGMDEPVIRAVSAPEEPVAKKK
jgi:hypothetical protein